MLVDVKCGDEGGNYRKGRDEEEKRLAEVVVCFASGGLRSLDFFLEEVPFQFPSAEKAGVVFLHMGFRNPIAS